MVAHQKKVELGLLFSTNRNNGQGAPAPFQIQLHRQATRFLAPSRQYGLGRELEQFLDKLQCLLA